MNKKIHQTKQQKKEKTMNPEMNDDFEIVNENELDFATRGRKSKITPEQINGVRELLKKNPNGWVKFSKFAIPSDLLEKKDQANFKAKVSATIRQIATKLGMECAIRWDKGITPVAKFAKVSK